MTHSGKGRTLEISGIRGVVTGATGGIGTAVARSLLERGASCVGLIARNSEKLDNLAAEFAAQYESERVFPMLADVRDEERLALVFDDYVSAAGGLELLVNNAGVLQDGALVAVSFKGIQKYPLSSWEETFGVNMTGTFLCSQLAVEKMARKRVKGLIVNISSISRHGRAGQAAYSASKGGIASFTYTMARELAPYGIRCCAIAPGLIDTPMAQRIPEGYRNDIVSHIAVGRIGRPDEVSHAVLFCIENDFFNGSILELDGGEFD